MGGTFSELATDVPTPAAAAISLVVDPQDSLNEDIAFLINLPRTCRTPTELSARVFERFCQSAKAQGLGLPAQEESLFLGIVLATGLQALQRQAGRRPVLSASEAEDLVAFGDALATLSPREQEVAVRVGRGMRGRDIAADLGTRLNTVRNQTAMIYCKLGVRSRTELALKLRAWQATEPTSPSLRVARVSLVR